MTRAFRDLWLKRCTDGTYVQAVGELACDDKHRCCLGVAHAVGQELGLISVDDEIRENDEHEELLPDEQAELFGVNNQDLFATANDHNFVPEGQFYPNEVLELIKRHPVVD